MDRQLKLDSDYLGIVIFVSIGKRSTQRVVFIMCENECASIELENLDIFIQSDLKDMYSNCVMKAGRVQNLQDESGKVQKSFEQINIVDYDSQSNI